MLRTLFFMENWVGSEMAGMKKAFFAIFDQPGPTFWPKRAKIWNSFFNCYLAALQPTLGHSQGESLSNQMLICVFKGCVHYIFASLFFRSKRKHLWNKGKCFLFHLKSSFLSWVNQILTFQIFKCHDIIKSLSIKHETHFTE